jgi:hypothetical protein
MRVLASIRSLDPVELASGRALAGAADARALLAHLQPI